jgi:uncharacterized repeat protein (TIGR01451 family)
MKTLKQYYYCLVLLLPLVATAQPWQRTFTQIASAYELTTLPTLDGAGYFVTGADCTQNQIPALFGFAMKIDRNGQIVWARYDSVRIAHAALARDSGFIETGFTKCQYGANSRCFIQKRNKNGGVVWRNYFNDGRTLFAVTSTVTSGYVVYGTRQDSVFLEKYDLQGNYRWAKVWKANAVNHNEGRSLLELPSGDLVLVNGFGANFQYPGFILRTDSLGNFLWRKEVPFDVDDFGVHNLIPVGNSVAYATHTARLHLLDSAGNVVWLARHGQFLTNWASHLYAKRRLGGYWMTYLGYENANRQQQYWYLAQLNEQGAIVSNKIVQKMEFFVAGLAESSDSTLIFYGRPANAPQQPLRLVQMDTSGQIRTNLIRGSLTSSCSTNLKDWLVGATRTDGVTFFDRTDDLNRYQIQTDTGVYTVTAYPTSQYWSATPIVVNQSQPQQIDTIPLIINCLANCAHLNVDLSIPILRRCVESHYRIQYCNKGTLPAQNAWIEIQLDPLLQYRGATIPLTSRVGQHLRFNLGTVGLNECRQFEMAVSPECSDATQVGQAICTSAHIYPDTICGNLPNWSGANLIISGTCERDSVHFTVSNIGRATSSLVRRVSMENATIVSNTTVSLAANSQKHYRFPANGNTWRLSVEQEPFHPYRNTPIAVVEGCRANANGGISTGFVHQLGLDTRNPAQRTDCQTIRGAFDPNDKTSFPAGYGANHWIELNQDIEYQVRFQNTGNDTAFTVVVTDTLSDLLDPTTLRPQSASHPYQWTILNKNVLKCTFSEIRLVDSFQNEPRSHGFIKFHIKQKPNILLGSKIYNRAAIFFDFNPPVLTNQTMLTIGKQFILSGVSEEASKGRIRIVNYPNPTAEHALLELLDAPNEAMPHTFQLFDATGRQLRQANFNGNRYEFERDGLNAGFYFFRVTQNAQIIGTGRIVIQ